MVITGPGLDVVKRPVKNTSVRLDRAKKHYNQFMERGKVFLRRAVTKLNYRFHHKSSERELVAMAIDSRLWGKDDILSVGEQLKSDEQSHEHPNISALRDLSRKRSRNIQAIR